jgi:importin subunit beta-1
VQRLEGEIKPQADRIMHTLLQVLSTLPPKSSVPDIVFAAVGAVASALEEDFLKYMESFSPFLYKALQNHEEPGLCAIGVGLVGDITRALNEKVQPFCDTFMNQMLSILVSNTSIDGGNPLANFGVDKQRSPGYTQTRRSRHFWRYCTGYWRTLPDLPVCRCPSPSASF